MALVLRKAVLPKNVSLLKCIKGRQLATTNNKKHAAPLLSTVLQRSFRSKSLSPVHKNPRRPQLPSLQCHNRMASNLGLSTSCPNILSLRKMDFPFSSFKRFNSTAYSLLTKIEKPITVPRTKSNVTLKKYYSKPCVAPCPCPPSPCGPCCKNACCLPPPCNTPPRCLQYMTGYYYYPYGTWFCGPYHVAGTCGPVCSKCPPGPCSCPKCCAACVYALPKADSTKADKTMDKVSTPAGSLPVEPWDIIAKTEKTTTEGKVDCELIKSKASDENDSDCKQNKKIPPTLASILHTFSHKSKWTTRPCIESSYSTFDPKLNSKSYHTKVDPMDAIEPKATNRKQKLSRNLHHQGKYVSSAGARNSLHRGRKEKKMRYNQSTTPKYLKPNRKPRVDADFEHYNS